MNPHYAHGHYHTDYTQFLDPAGLRGARVGVARNFKGFPERVIALLDEAVEVMRKSGAFVADPADIPQLTDADWSAQDVVLQYEFKEAIAKYLESLGPGAPMRSLSDIIAFNEAHSEAELTFFGQEVFVSAMKRGSLAEPAYLNALRTIQKHVRQDGIDAVMDRYSLDAIVAPATGPACLIDHVLGDRFDAGYSVAQAAIAGYPNITVPMGSVFGLPVGLSFFGRPWSEPVLLRVAYAYEQSTNHRESPTFRPTTG